MPGSSRWRTGQTRSPSSTTAPRRLDHMRAPQDSMTNDSAPSPGRSRPGACVESSLTNHFLVADSPEADPAAISAPSLIVHSESDPLFPLPHGAALAQMIPNATLLRVDSMGHGTPPPHTWSVIVPALIVHCLANDEAAH